MGNSLSSAPAGRATDCIDSQLEQSRTHRATFMSERCMLYVYE